MRKNFYLLIMVFSLVSCYTYQVKKQPDPKVENKQASDRNRNAENTTPLKTKKPAPESQNINSQPPAPVNVQQKLAPNKNFKIDVNGKSYKIIVDRWESDSLVAHQVHNPKRILKFHKNQINPDRIAEKRFSQPIADIITVAAYTGIGVAIWYLVR